MMEEYEVIIGLEVHVELATKTKIFCGCSTEFGSEPNVNTCPVCTGMPGSLPVLNKKVVEHAIAVGVATNCQITQNCKFDRKNYFYPDNPQNYQISQLYLPICRNGKVDIEVNNEKKSIRIHEIHMEEDAGKLIHDEDGSTLVDFNRSGVPLIEIVSEPDMRNSDEVIKYLKTLQMIVQDLGVSDGKLQEGSMRADINLSVRKKGETKLGTRTETKNMNSFKAIGRTIEHETKRQIDLLESGKEVIQETRRWDDEKGDSYAMRSKEDAQDYRYFPDPDLVPISISDGWISEIKAKQPEFRMEKMERYKEKYNISMSDAEIIAREKTLTSIFEKAVEIYNQPKKIANWLVVETIHLLKEKNREADEISYSAENLAKLVELVDEGVINSNIAKQVFEIMFEKDIDPKKYVVEHGLVISDNMEEIQKIVAKVIEENPQAVQQYRDGEEKVLGFLVGNVMKELKGKGNPQKIRAEIIKVCNA